MNILGYSASYTKADLTPYNFEHLDTHAKDVIIEILYCSVGHTDLPCVQNN